MRIASFLCALLLVGSVRASVIYNDSTGDIDPGIATGNGTLDILSMEVSHTELNILLSLTVNGNVGTTDWGKFMIGIATGGSGTTAGNGWGRPINLDSPIGGMDFWIGSWVDGGSGAQLWSYNSGTTSWDGPGALANFGFTAGAQSVLNYTVSRAALGLTGNDAFYFEVYSSGGGVGDSAIDALSNPNVSVTDWGQAYTSDMSSGLSLYSIPEPSAVALLGIGALMALSLRRRRRRS